MNAKMHVVFEGAPERIQEAVDILDRAFPESVNCRLAKSGRDRKTRLEGDAAAYETFSHPPIWAGPSESPGKIWKLGSSKTRETQRSKWFCASLSKGFQS